MRPWKWVSVVLSAAIVFGGGTAAATAGGQSGWKTVKVRFTPTALVVNQAGSACDTANQCAVLSTVTATQTGDLQGSTAQGQILAFNETDVLPQSMLGTFTGNVNGCGTGGFPYKGSSIGSKTTLRYTATYTIVRGTSTGALADVTGVLTQEGSLTDATPAPIRGVLRCRA